MRHIILALNTQDQFTDLTILKQNGFEAKPLIGQYQHETGRIVKESSYLIKVESGRDLLTIKNLAKFHQQESILVLDLDQNAELLYISSGKVQNIGVFTNCTEAEAKSSQSHTFDPISKEYYICV